MLDFNYQNTAKIIFGLDSINKLENELKENNVKNLLILSSGDFIKDLGIYDKVIKICNKLNVTYVYNNSVVPNPKVELIRDLIKQNKDKCIDLILAIGGGSVIDSAKAISVGLESDLDIWDFFEKGIEIKKTTPIGVISTIPSSGSETSNCSIVSNGEFKLGIETDLIIPKFAIINPEYTLSLPKYQTSVGLCDISTHLIERYYSDIDYTDTTDYMIEGLLKALILNSYRLINNPSDINARSEVFLMSIFAHNNILDSGRMADWASHRIEHEISAEYGITHGEGMAVVLVAYTKYLATRKPNKLAQLANRLFNIDYANHSKEEMALMLAENLEKFYIDLGLRTRLSKFNIDDSNFEKMALRATKNDTCKIGHYIGLDSKEIIEVLNIAL